MMGQPKPFNLTLKGLRIPFVAAWEGELASIGFDPVVGMDAVFTGAVDHREAAASGQLGKVVLGEMAPQRQRYVMAYGLCQVCGKLLENQVLLGHIDAHGHGLLAYDEPPCCPSCALAAIELCPYVTKQWEAQGGMLIQGHDMHIQLAKLEAGDDRHKFSRKGAPGLSRPMFRRYMGKTLAVHLRLVPEYGARIQGVMGITALQGLAQIEKGHI